MNTYENVSTRMYTFASPAQRARTLGSNLTNMNEIYRALQVTYMTHLLRGRTRSNVHPIAFGVSFLQSQFSIDDLVLWVFFATCR